MKDAVVETTLFKFPQTCPQFAVFALPSSNRVSLSMLIGKLFKSKSVLSTRFLLVNIIKEVYIGLSQFCRLYVNKTEIANNCNSFYVHDENLIFTDHSGALKFIDLMKIGIKHKSYYLFC